MSRLYRGIWKVTKLARIRQIIRDYHYALDMREHGGLAAYKALDEIQRILNMQWVLGREKERRDG